MSTYRGVALSACFLAAVAGARAEDPPKEGAAAPAPQKEGAVAPEKGKAAAPKLGQERLRLPESTCRATAALIRELKIESLTTVRVRREPPDFDNPTEVPMAVLEVAGPAKAMEFAYDILRLVMPSANAGIHFPDIQPEEPIYREYPVPHARAALLARFVTRHSPQEVRVWAEKDTLRVVATRDFHWVVMRVLGAQKYIPMPKPTEAIVAMKPPPGLTAPLPKRKGAAPRNKVATPGKGGRK